MNDNRFNALASLVFAAVLAITGGFLFYIHARQSECEEKNATLVRKPLGIGWNCVAKVPVK